MNDEGYDRAAFEIGEKVIEMMERLTASLKFHPGAEASWRVGVDDEWFELTMRPVKKESDQ